MPNKFKEMYIAQQSPKTGKYGIWLAFPLPESLISANSNIKVCQQPKWLCLPDRTNMGYLPVCINSGHAAQILVTGSLTSSQVFEVKDKVQIKIQFWRDLSLTMLFVLETNLIWPSIQDVQVWLAWYKVVTFTGGFHKMMLLCWQIIPV